MKIVACDTQAHVGTASTKMTLLGLLLLTPQVLHSMHCSITCPDGNVPLQLLAPPHKTLRYPLLVVLVEDES